MSRLSRCLWGACWVIGATYGISACGGDDSTPVIVTPIPPTLTITALQPVGGPRWEPGSSTCVEVGTDPAQTIAVLVALGGDFKLRPPGACGSSTLCGTLVLRLDPSGDTETARAESATETLELAFDSIPLGTHTFRVELVKQSGVNVIDKEAGAPLASEVTLDVTAPGGCSGVLPDGGSDAAADAADAGPDADAGDDAGDASEDADASDDANDASGDADATSDADASG